MVVEVRLFANFRDIVGKKRIFLSAKDIKHLLNRLLEKHQELKKEFFEDPTTQKLKDDVIIFLNGRNIIFLDGLETLLEDGDKVTVFSQVAGG